MNLQADLNTVWFFLVGILFTGYAILDGFDLGVGTLHLFTNTDDDRRLVMNSIGPVWDGNEVWLVTGGGALFAAFPEAYATVFSGFYLAFMLFLFALIFRAVAIEFRSKRPMRWWRRGWDASFSLSSILGSLLVGVALGNVAWGVPLDEHREFAGTFLGLLHPYALLVGVTTVALFSTHGAIYVVIKTEGELQDRYRRLVRWASWTFVACYAATTLAALLFVPQLTAPFRSSPWLTVVPFATLLAVLNIPREAYRGHESRAFASSCLTIAGMLGTFGVGMYPKLVHSNPAPEHSLDIYNAASSSRTLGIMLIVACIGMPLVIGYTTAIYRIFRGKVHLTEHSY